MKEEWFPFSSEKKPVRMAAYCWSDEEIKPSAAVQICHGMCEYLRRYRPFIEFLTKEGFLVFGMDFPGHGESPRLNQNCLGDFGGEHGTAVLADDIGRLRRRMKRKTGELPCFLLGHSMGSFAARMAAETDWTDWDGLILSGTAGKNPLAEPAKGLLYGLELMKGKKFVSPSVLRQLNRMFNRGIENPQTEVDWLSRDAAVCREYSGNPQCMFHYTVEGYLQILDLLERCNREEWFRKFPRRMPVFLFSGEDDPVGDYGAGPEQVAVRLRRQGCRDVQLKLYPGGRHEMLNEINRPEVWSDVVYWMKGKINT